jgi:hypothetical protein
MRQSAPVGGTLAQIHILSFGNKMGHQNSTVIQTVNHYRLAPVASFRGM